MQKQLTSILDRWQCRKRSVVAVISGAALDVVRPGGMPLLRSAAGHQIRIAVQGKLLVCGGAPAGNAFNSVLVADPRLPALDRILAEVGVGRRVRAVGRFAAVAFVSESVQRRK